MLAELIQAEMRTKQWKSRDPLIRKSGLSQAMISKLVRGEIVNISAHTADRLAFALNIPADLVFAAALADVRKAAHQQEAVTTGDAA